MLKNLFLAAACLLLAVQASAQKPINVDQELAFAAQQYQRLLASHPDTTKFPQSTNPDGSPRDMPSSWWCSGFFGGSLWYLYEHTKAPEWKTAAERWTQAVAKEQYNTRTHDLGFMLYCPFGNGYRLTKNSAYPAVLVQGAKSLSTRFDPKVGVIKSWDTFKAWGTGQTYNYPVIIDNMMNLELLFWASKITGDPSFRRLAITHADNTLKNHFRPDFSSFHVVCYNPDGSVAAKKTAQGAADASAWARGQAWGLYGYTVMYRETKDPKYLAQARHIADFYLNHPNLPADKIPYWDFNAPGIPKEERDASAAAVAASALLELSQYSKPDQKRYFQAAETMLVSLASPAYKAKLGENNNFLLKHSVGSKPAKSEVDVPLVYADYYFLEGLLRYQALAKK
ncbi:glycoside hydrolase family 88 protein [Hymenobacter sp. GOD-10R]|uniref:glycoside hydrolase family 88 protein n=1 Tax=Hymenobacter sp. GOD-10R TaxID=3093922 RepID=UPI002D7956F7|nr:glycoside hydrolase family 88 protein [Hymenobacter sp. GOD-10R]WRQ31102.1 glycoside hydrolase family 88 protein [Hymenobacter sp. GOD-10R]